MKKTGLFLLLFMFFGISAFSQKFAIVDTEYILSNIPAYNAAQEKLDNLSKKWQQEVEQGYSEIDELYKEYQSEKVLLSDEMKRKREEKIINKEQEVKQLQKKYFGPEGELQQRRKELVQPIQDEVYKAIEELSQSKRYDAIFDTAAGAIILYFNSQIDVSDEILVEMGYKQ